jgi:O-antigen/teichoic acid export membrane protein
LSTAKKILKNFLSLSTAEIVCRILGFFAVAYLARILGTDGFGQLGFSLAILSYFLLLTNLGLGTLGTKEIARDLSRIGNFTDNIITIRFLSAIFSFLLLLLFLFLIDKPKQLEQLILLFGLTVFTASLFLDWIFIGLEKMELVSLSKIVQQVVYVALIFLLVKKGGEIKKVPVIFFVSNIAMVLVLILFLAKNFRFFHLSFNLSLWKQILVKALPLGWSFAMIQIYYSFDSVLLGFFKDDKTVGYYTAAYKIVLFLSMFGGFYYSAIFPKVSFYYQTSKEKLGILLSYSIKFASLAVFPLGVGAIFTADPIMRFVYGKEFVSGAVPFVILVWTLAIIWVSMAYGNSLIACDQERKYAKGVTLGAIVNLIFNLIFIPYFSMIGAAIAKILSEGTVFIFMYIQFSKIIKINFGQYLLKPIAASGLMGVFMYFTKSYLGLFPLIIFSSLVYLGLIFLVKGITKEEITNFKKRIIAPKV